MEVLTAMIFHAVFLQLKPEVDDVKMQEMVRILLGLEHVPHPDDAADALAVAICHQQTAPFLDRLASQPGSAS